MSLQIIDELGFKEAAGHEVLGRVSIADLFPKSRNRCGIYLLQFSDGTYYIGQAVDAVRRFAQHRKNYDTIAHYWFQRVTKLQLDSVEQQLIRQAEQAGLLLTNKTFVTNVVGETDLDLLVIPAEQQTWVETGSELTNDGIDLSQAVEERAKVKYRQNFLQLEQHCHYPQLRSLLRAYIQRGLPAYKKTEQAFWALSCLPSTNKATYPRFCSLNVNGMEVLVAGVEKKSQEPFVFTIVSGSMFPTATEKHRFQKAYARVIAASDYRAAGVDQFVIQFRSLEALQTALEREPAFGKSIREMNLRLMRRGGTVYSPYHCFDLVADALRG